MFNLLWGARRLFEAALAVPVGIAAMVIGRMGNEWMKSAADVKEPVATKQTAPAKKTAATVRRVLVGLGSPVVMSSTLCLR